MSKVPTGPTPAAERMPKRETQLNYRSVNTGHLYPR